MGWTATEATNGRIGLERLEESRPDAIILDIALPKMSGTDLMEYIASTTPEALSSIVVVTGLEASEIRKLFPEMTFFLPLLMWKRAYLSRSRSTVADPAGRGAAGRPDRVG